MYTEFRRGQRGTAIVEFALIVLFVFFPLLFGIIEFGRLMYLYNTIQEVTRHAARDAAVTDFTNSGAMSTVRQNAIFRTAAGSLVAGGEVSDASVTIAYLNSALGFVDQSATCPSKNVEICLSNQEDPTCIRFVRARICQPGTDCTPVPFSPITGWFPFLNDLNLPTSDAIIPAESLGYRPNLPTC